ncbi:PREDICTED: asparagine synthetase domain-containing protein 1 [Cyphomyrmex costatus]|uniref:Asparagine synthetase domain-containing protein 1 n=1 Tax=Cyphomyrmex costatus TaxID=456900 RepID=A0A151IMR4_9HYME|nr:PREDICTED: asparagine synthetase domain-containing protein 1 [Cyphomyrmex costatus]XP_018407158.1 PREDICTED: asparagine synthetase domain-containing protein 1 [Cyphomyrmex costatus]KYN06245.1 Asparagine synthetase domain-containing protein 1 [Cyphomyrmex costatus]
MCGIFCSIYQPQQDSESSKQWNICKDAIAARGPDYFMEKHFMLNNDWHGHFAAAVLWMQGSKITTQPSLDDNDNLLLWNGDIFSGCLAKDDVCDTNIILAELQSTTNIMSVLRKMEGPYCLVYYQKSSNMLYFGRDIIGRHSLLLKVDNKSNSLTLTSVANKEMREIVEVPAIGIFVMNLNMSQINLACYPWKEPDLMFTDVIDLLETNLNVDIDIKETISNTCSSALTNLHLHPEPKDVEYLENASCNKDFNEVLQCLLKNQEVNERVESLSKLLHQSVKIRIKKKPNYCKECIKIVLNDGNVICAHSKIGVLFSGGLDSAILAAIAHEYIPEDESIDLINVAFERPESQNQSMNNMNEKRNVMQKYDVPDRKTGRQTYSELLRMYPNRKWNFIECNITQVELQLYRASRICDLLYPLRTILDESLGCAMWFASRAKGVLYPVNEIYESPCRILLLGIGADELFGGYMRHRTILKHKGWDALVEELSIELNRISERNLGRDDRIVSDHGKQSRLPYLDENLVKHVQQMKPWERCYPTEKMPSGLGDKLLLRLLACKIGFQYTANFPKRAFQFGSRIANGKENANDVSNRL